VNEIAELKSNLASYRIMKRI